MTGNRTGRPGEWVARPAVEIRKSRCVEMSALTVLARPQRSSRNLARLQNDDLRRLLARELHDRVAQTLTTMLIELENYKVEQHGRKSVLRQIDALQTSTRDVLSNLREVLYELRSDTPEIGESFEDAIRSLAERFETRSSITTTVSVSEGWPSRVKSPAALNLYRIIEEGFTNVRQHSGASQASIMLSDGVDHFVAVLADNGRGFDVDLSAPTGMGMLGMHERALFLGAELRVAVTPETGTVLTVLIPRKSLV
jgi:signal transduction histidine kinase